MQYKPHGYQDHAFKHAIDNNFSGLFLDMGLGKTVITLTAINHLIYRDCAVERVLVVGTKRIIRNVWKQEAEKWDHLKHMKINIVWGSPQERINALREKADIYLINRENFVWLQGLFQSKFPFPMVVIDESSSFKSHSSHRFRAMKMVRDRIERLILLTGTPAPNGYMDLWSQIYLLDKGQRLEKTISGFRERYFVRDGNSYFVYRLRREADKNIQERIGDICISMKAEDYLDVPPIIENDIYLSLPTNLSFQYELFEEEAVTEIADREITALNAAALNTKLMQFANGAIYHADKTFSVIHDEKLDALEEIINEAQGQPVMVAYAYRHDLIRIKERFKQARELHDKKDEDDWNANKIPLLVLHPASAGHGLNLQYGGAHIIVWFGLTWNLEHYLQLIARLKRQGQVNSVIVHRLVMLGTIDEKAAVALRKKDNMQGDLMDALKAIVTNVISRRKQKGLPAPLTDLKSESNRNV